ncbi:MAG: FHA domain-containing protein [Thermoplasmatota archaeon]
MPDPRALPVDYATLAELLAALGYSTRLEIVERLRFPHTLGELRIAPARVREGENPDRAVARQTVQAHLEKLVEADLVRMEQVELDGRLTNRYVVNRQRLYALTEDLRRLGVLQATQLPAEDLTVPVGAGASAPDATGPRLTLVHGVYEGKAFALDAKSAADGKWTIGRRVGLPVSLDYDPFVSTENAYVSARDGRFTLTDVRESKNGTMLNWRPLAKGATVPLKACDVIGVGRSLLVFAAE